MANVCACGCGGLLPEGSVRQYKRGHKTRIDNPDSFDDTAELADDSEESFGPLTLDDAARDTPDDPEPRDRTENKPKTVVKITPSIRRDIEGKVAFGFAMIGQTWSMVDPVCGSVLIDNGDKMAKKYAPLICRSPDMVKWLTKSGTYILWVEAFIATVPVLQVVFAHHIAKSLSAELVSQNGTRPAPNDYVVQ